MDKINEIKELLTNKHSLNIEHENIINKMKNNDSKIRFIVLNFLDLLVNNNLTKEIMINNNYSINDAFSKINPYIEQYTNKVILASEYNDSDQKKSINALIVSNNITLISNDETDFAFNKTLIKFPIECINDLDQIKKIISDKLEKGQNEMVNLKNQFLDWSLKNKE